MMCRMLLPVLFLALVSAGGTQALAHDDPNSGSYDLLVPGDFWHGSISFVTLIGPPAGEEVLHTTFHLTFFSPPGGTCR